MSQWHAVMLLTLQGLLLGLAVGQALRLYRENGKVRLRLDERPATRVELLVAVAVLVVATTTLIRVDVDTRDCVEDALELIEQVQTTGVASGPIIANC